MSTPKPSAPSDVTIASTPIHDGLFVKPPVLNTAFLGNDLLPKLVLGEVEVLELLKKNPHTNICAYYGCLTARGRIVGLVFDRLSATLYERLEERHRDFDSDGCMDGIASVVRHLHSLGLAHNDLNPANIMVDEFDAVFVIDFGSCRPFGGELITAGSRGWVDEEFMTSAAEHDCVALGKMRSWLALQRRSDATISNT